MCSKEQLKAELDKIPADYPYQALQYLKEAHFELHQLKNAQDVLKSNSVESLLNAIQSSNHVSLDEALNKLIAVDQIIQSSPNRDGNNQVLEIFGMIFTDHNPPQNINHKI